MNPLRVPNMPTQEERDRHEIDHCPYQSWCRSCVAGRGKADAHFARESDDLKIDCVACDYCFMGELVEDERMSDKCLPILVHKFFPDRWVTSHVVRKKGVDDWAVKVAAQDLEASGSPHFIYKSDGEPSIRALKAAAVRKLRETSGEVVVKMEESGVGESAQNAIVERAIWEVESMARVLCHAASELHGVQFPLTHPIRVFAVEYASQLLNRSQRSSKDNRTAYELRKGRPYRRKLPMYAEAVLYLRVAEKRRRRKFEDRWATGIYLGLVERSNMVLIGTPEGVRKVNCIKRLPRIQAKDPLLAQSVKGYPWSLSEGARVADGDDEAAVMVATEPIVPEEDLPPPLPRLPRGPEALPRRVYIRREVELQRYGFTLGCRGCVAARDGGRAATHSDECRRRIEAAMAEDEGVRDRLEKAREARGEEGVRRDGRAGPEPLAAGEALEHEAQEGQDVRLRGAPPVSGLGEQVGRGEGVRAEPPLVVESHAVRSDPPLESRVGGSASSSSGGQALEALPRVPSEDGDGDLLREVGFFGMSPFSGGVLDLEAVYDSDWVEGISALERGKPSAVVSEIFCKNRFTSRASQFGLHPGYALDLTTGWDLNKPEEEKAAFELLDRVRPYLLVGSPACSAWSQLMGFGTGKATQEARLQEARRHLSLCFQMYNKQHDEGRLFLHEHPHGAGSWREPCVERLLSRSGVWWVRNDQCEAGQGITMPDGEWISARKTTGWITNSRCIADELASFQCRNRDPDAEPHAHAWLVNGRAKATEVYPEVLVSSILRGLRRHLQIEGKMSVSSLEPGVTGHDELDIPEDEIEKFYDDVSGKMLPSSLVRRARLEEIEFLRRFPVYEKVPENQARGKPRVSVRWCDVNKGDDDNMQVRSRLVGREFKWQDPFMQGTFAATPPLEGLRYLFHWTVTKHRWKGRVKEMKILVMDVSRAHFHPPSVRELYITLPEEDASPGMVGRLLRTLYGTRDAANQWDSFFNKEISELGYKVGESNPCLYMHRDLFSIGWRHGDDLVFAGEDGHMKSLFVELQKKMIVKQRALLGFDDGDDKHVSILNRLIDLTNENGVRKITYEPDPRHVDLLLQHLQLDGPNVRPVSTPGEKKGDYLDDTPLSPEDSTMFRSCTMRLAYLAVDLPHLQFVANRLARAMSKPTRGGWNRIKRAARFLKGSPRWIQEFRLEEPSTYLDVWTDSDWAGDTADRKSVTCVIAMVGGHFLRSSVATQSSPALSSGEAEYVGNVKGGSIAIGIQAMAKDFGDDLKIRLRTDSSAAKGICGRIGLGKIRHLDVALLWLQHHVNSKRIQLLKVSGGDNLADIGTKDVDSGRIAKFMKNMGFRNLMGRHPRALTIRDEKTTA